MTERPMTPEETQRYFADCHARNVELLLGLLSDVVAHGDVRSQLSDELHVRLWQVAGFARFYEGNRP